MHAQVTSPSGGASPQGTPCDVPGIVRRVPAQWVRPWGPRLDPPSAGTPLASWPSTVLITHIENPLEAQKWQENRSI